MSGWVEDDVETAVTIYITSSSDCAAVHIFIKILVQFCTVGMLHVLISVKSSYKGWYINKDIYQNGYFDS